MNPTLVFLEFSGEGKKMRTRASNETHQMRTRVRATRGGERDENTGFAERLNRAELMGSRTLRDWVLYIGMK